MMKNFRVLRWRILICLIFSSASSGAGDFKIDGYKEAKWGMSPSQVKQALKLDVKEQVGHSGAYKQSDYVRFKLQGPLLIECWFFHGKLYRVKYPFFSSDQKTSDARNVLEKKYGKPTARGFLNAGTCTAQGDGGKENGYTECVSWTEGASRITLWGSTAGTSQGYARDVDYENLEMRRLAEDEAKATKKADGQHYKDSKLQQLKDQL